MKSNNFFFTVGTLLTLVFLVMAIFMGATTLPSLDEGYQKTNLAQSSGNLIVLGTITKKEYHTEVFGKMSSHWATVTINDKVFRLAIKNETFFDGDTLYLSDVAASNIMKEGTQIYCNRNDAKRTCVYGREI